MSFYEGQLEQQICYSSIYSANFLYPWLLINLTWWSSSLRLHQVCPPRPWAKYIEKYSNTLQLLSLINDYNNITITGPVEM